MKAIRIAAALSAAALALSACDVEQTEEGTAPEIDVDADAGSLPEYRVDTAEVGIETETRTVEVPTLEVEEADASEAIANEQ